MLTTLTSLAGCAHRGPEAIVEEFVRAQNTHDVERVLSLLDEDFVFRDPGRTFEVSRADVRPLFEWDAATRWRGEAGEIESSGDTVQVELTETNEFLERLGLGPLSHDVTFVVEGERIREIVASFDVALQQAVDAAVEPIVEWARATRPASLEGLVGPDGVVYDGTSASGWLSLLREARRAGIIE